MEDEDEGRRGYRINDKMGWDGMFFFFFGMEDRG